MKCIRYKDGVVDRVPDRDAAKLVLGRQAVYVPRHVWKAETRDVELEQE